MARKSETPASVDDNAPLDQSELKRHVGYFLARARFIAFRTFEEHIGQACDLRPVEFALMVLLNSNRNVTQKRLARSLGVAQPNMTGVMRRLEARGLVERTRNELDKRAQFLSLTAAGGKVLQQAVTAGKDMDQGWLRALSPAEQAMLVELLDKITLSRPPGE